MRFGIQIAGGLAALWLAACTADYTPKPRGYFRINPPVTAYRDTSVGSLPFTFRLSGRAVLREAGSGTVQHWFYIVYPDWKAKLYCSYLSGTREVLTDAYVEFLHMPGLIAGTEPTGGREPVWSFSDGQHYGELFCNDTDPASPMRFVVFGGSSEMLRGMLFYDCPVNADSLAPVNAYLRQDIIELITSVKWND